MLREIVFEDLRDLWHERVIRVWIRKKRANAQQDLNVDKFVCGFAVGLVVGACISRTLLGKHPENKQEKEKRNYC